MRYFAAFYLVLLAVALACGMPATGYIAPTDTTTPVYQPTAAVATLPTVTAKWKVVRVAGCWNLRETPGGMITGQACNRDLSVTVDSDGGWYESPLGWICGRAFGVDVTCKLVENT